MFDIGGPEFILLMLLALLVFGPRKLPGLGRQAGSLVAKLRLAVRDFQGQLEREVAFQEVRDAAREVKDVRTETRTLGYNLITQVGPPPYVDPSRTNPEPEAPTPTSGGPAQPEDPQEPSQKLTSDPRPGQG